MSIAHSSSSTTGKNTQRINHASKAERKHGVSQKFINQIRRSAESKTNPGRKTHAP